MKLTTDTDRARRSSLNGLYGENEEKFEIIFDNKILRNKIKLNFLDVSFYLDRELWKLKDSNSSITYNQKTKEFNLTNLFIEAENQSIKTKFDDFDFDGKTI